MPATIVPEARTFFISKSVSGVDFHALPLLMHTYLCLQLVHSMLTANCEARLGFKKQELSE